MSKSTANALLQELYEKLSKRWNGKGKFSVSEAYELCRKIVEELATEELFENNSFVRNSDIEVNSSTELPNDLKEAQRKNTEEIIEEMRNGLKEYKTKIEKDIENLRNMYDPHTNPLTKPKRIEDCFEEEKSNKAAKEEIKK